MVCTHQCAPQQSVSLPVTSPSPDPVGKRKTGSRKRCHRVILTYCIDPHQENLDHAWCLDAPTHNGIVTRAQENHRAQLMMSREVNKSATA